jgi:hypothetical protein
VVLGLHMLGSWDLWTHMLPQQALVSAGLMCGFQVLLYQVLWWVAVRAAV